MKNIKEMNLPLVSIIIPVFKVEKFIIRCLKSVENQTYKNIECILVDDCGPDQSIDISNQYILENSLDNFKIIKQTKNMGLSMARNAGIDEAKGKYLYFLDSDDEITEFAIEKLVDLAERTDAELTLGHCICVNENAGWKRDYFPILVKEDILEGNDKIFKNFLNDQYPVMACDKLVRRDFILDNKLYFVQDLYSQDVLWSFQSAFVLNKLAILREDTYIYYFHDASIIHNRGKKHFENWITIAGYINRAYLDEVSILKKKMLLKYLIGFKASTLEMNWKAKQDETLWKESYEAYSKLGKLRLTDYFSSDFSEKEKKNNLFTALPKNIAFKVFKWRYER